MKLAYIDSCIWITRFEGLSSYKSIIMHELQHLAQTGWTFCTSEVVWLEVLLKPMQHGQNTVIQKYRGFLTTLKMLKHHPDVFKNALLIAHSEKLKALDAIHVARTIIARCLCQVIRTFSI